MDARAADAPMADAPMPDVPDAAIAIDANNDGPPSTSPRCTTAPTLFWDVSPKQLSNMKRAGDILYVSAFDLTNGGTTARRHALTLSFTGASLKPVFLGILQWAHARARSIRAVAPRSTVATAMDSR